MCFNYASSAEMARLPVDHAIGDCQIQPRLITSHVKAWLDLTAFAVLLGPIHRSLWTIADDKDYDSSAVNFGAILSYTMCCEGYAFLPGLCFRTSSSNWQSLLCNPSQIHILKGTVCLNIHRKLKSSRKFTAQQGTVCLNLLLQSLTNIRAVVEKFSFVVKRTVLYTGE